MAQEMRLELSVLHSMIDYWVRKGKLREVNSRHQTCYTCGVQAGCSFVVVLPHYYELVVEGTTSADPPCVCGSGQC